MANHCRLAADTAIAACDAIADLCDAGEAEATIVFYTGAEPDYADDAAGTEVATLTCNDPAFAAAAADAGNHWADCALDVDPEVQDTDATGNESAVTYFRFLDSDSNIIMQGTLGTSGADINLNSTTIGAGAEVTMTSFELRVGYNTA